MPCQTCKSERVMEVGAKCNDLFHCDLNGEERHGYAPDDAGIGKDGDYLNFDYCLDCGQIQGEFPVHPAMFEPEDE